MPAKSGKYPKVNLAAREKKMLIEKLTEEQENKCYLCSGVFGDERNNRNEVFSNPYPINKKVLDHNHDTGEPRKLLCDDCNARIDSWEKYVPIQEAARNTDMLKRRKIESIQREIERIEEEIKILEELDRYIRTGECKPYILEHYVLSRFSVHDYIIAGNYMQYAASKRLNQIAMQSDEMRDAIKKHLIEAEARAINEWLEKYDRGEIDLS